MYGRAKFALLRGRILFASAAVRSWPMLVRWGRLPFSVGIEDTNDPIADLEQALVRVTVAALIGAIEQPEIDRRARRPQADDHMR